MIDNILEWLGNFYDSIIAFIGDLPLLFLQMILEAVAFIFAAIPLPSFLTDYSLSSYIDSNITYLLIQSSFPESLAVIRSAIAFKILRRVLTLGIW